MLEGCGVDEGNWRVGIDKDPNFAYSETPRYIGRAVASLAADPHKHQRTGTATATWELAKAYEFVDVDGTQPDWGQRARDLGGSRGARRGVLTLAVRCVAQCMLIVVVVNVALPSIRETLDVSEARPQLVAVA